MLQKIQDRICVNSIHSDEIQKSMEIKTLQTNVSGGNKEEDERVGVTIEIRELVAPNDTPTIAVIFRINTGNFN